MWNYIKILGEGVQVAIYFVKIHMRRVEWSLGGSGGSYCSSMEDGEAERLMRGLQRQVK